MAEYISMFKTPEGEAAYYKAYERVLSLWEVPYESSYLTTSFGDTHLLTAGPPDGFPLLLIHASGGSSTMWAPSITHWSRQYRTYAIDVIGEVGKSKSTRPILTRKESNDWLVEVLDALGIKGCFVAGQSKGAWLALNLALSYPQRVEKLVLLGPAYSFQAICQKFYRKFAWLMLRPTKSVATEFLQWMSIKDINHSPLSAAIAEQMYLGIKHLKVHKALVPDVFSDEELSMVKAKTLLLVGAQEVLHEPKFIIERAKQFIPEIEAHILPNAGHTVVMDQPDLVNQKVWEFLTN